MISLKSAAWSSLAPLTTWAERKRQARCRSCAKTPDSLRVESSHDSHLHLQLPLSDRVSPPLVLAVTISSVPSSSTRLSLITFLRYLHKHPTITRSYPVDFGLPLFELRQALSLPQSRSSCYASYFRSFSLLPFTQLLLIPHSSILSLLSITSLT
jgi:hypothetical protein